MKIRIINCPMSQKRVLSMCRKMDFEVIVYPCLYLDVLGDIYYVSGSIVCRSGNCRTLVTVLGNGFVIINSSGPAGYVMIG